MVRIVGVLGLLTTLLSAGTYAAPAPILMHSDVDIDGKPLRIDVALQLQPATKPGGATRVQARIDLAPVVAALRSELLRQLPQDRCKGHRADNWVGELRRYGAWVEADRLIFEVELDVQLWACVDIRGVELRKRLSRGRVVVQLPLRAAVDEAGLRLQAGRPWVDAYGPLGNAARAYFGLRGEQLGDRLAQRLARLNARQHAYPVPALWLHEGKLLTAQFVDAGRPTLELVAELQPKLPGWMDWMLRPVR